MKRDFIGYGKEKPKISWPQNNKIAVSFVVNIEEGVTGLLHISELPKDSLDNYSSGDAIDVQITRIDEDSMKVFLKLP